MISESQERMVAVVEPARLAEVRAACERWELPCTVIGEVTGDGMLRVLHDGSVAGEIPARFLTEETPRYELELLQTPAAAAGPRAAANDEPKTWIFEQYDHLVGSRTVKRPGLDAAVLRLDAGRGLAVSLDGPPIGCRSPIEAGWRAVMAAAMNVACSGGEPLALTDCLNFGSPERPEIAWELAEAIEGIARAAESLQIPIVSGNVSLYNETGGRPIPPTPIVGCVGLVRDLGHVPSRWRQGDRILLLRGFGHGLVSFVWRYAHLFSLAHDVSSGGVDVALREAAWWSGNDFVASKHVEAGDGVVVAVTPAVDVPWDDVVELGEVR
jgi:phosphoribosylformylglycinamidine synthase